MVVDHLLIRLLEIFHRGVRSDHVYIYYSPLSLKHLQKVSLTQNIDFNLKIKSFLRMNDNSALASGHWTVSGSKNAAPT